MTSERWPVVVIGAGAAGMFAATFAARAGARTLLLESAARPGAKIRVSGGGRCNVLPSAASPEDFHTEGSLRTVRNVLRRWPLAEVHRFFTDDLGVALKTEATGKVFPVSDDAREVVAALLRAVDRSGAELLVGTTVTAIGAEGPTGPWAITTDAGAISADRVVLATGGLSLPKTGSNGAGYTFAEGLGHDLLPRYPALVPLTLDDRALAALSGVAVQARLTTFADGMPTWSAVGDLLLTHKGLSGPVALDASHQLTAPWGRDRQITIGWGGLDASAWDARLRDGDGRRPVRTVVAEALPKRLAAHLMGTLSRDAGGGRLADRRLGDLRREDRLHVATALGAGRIEVRGDEGYRVAEVTGGGVALREIVTRTFESRHGPGLHLAGEILDVTGRLGGFNFLWAWVSGRIAGEAAASGALSAGAATPPPGA